MPKFEYDLIKKNYDKYDASEKGYTVSDPRDMERWNTRVQYEEMSDTVKSLINDIYPGQFGSKWAHIFLNTDGDDLGKHVSVVFDGSHSKSENHVVNSESERVIGFFQKYPDSKLQIALPDGTFHYMTFSNDRFAIDREPIPVTKEPVRPSLWDRIKSIFTKVPAVEKYNEDLKAYKNYVKEHPKVSEIRNNVKELNKSVDRHIKKLEAKKRKEIEAKQAEEKAAEMEARKKKAEEKKAPVGNVNQAPKKTEADLKKAEEAAKKAEAKRKKQEEKDRAREKANKDKQKKAKDKRLAEAAKKKAKEAKKNSKGKPVKSATLQKEKSPAKPLDTGKWTDDATPEQFRDFRAKAEADAPELKQLMTWLRSIVILVSKATSRFLKWVSTRQTPCGL